MPSKKNIAVLVGGYSGEHAVSLLSAKYIEKQLVSDRYIFYKIFITKNSWHYISKNNQRIEVDKNDFSIRLGANKIKFNAAFILVHGTPGEDGLLQAYLDMIGIPYPSSGVLSSAMTFDKKLTNTIASSHGITVANSITINRDDPVIIDQILKKVSLPLFVKPNEGGSSLGTAKVTRKNQLANSIQEALLEDNSVLVEEFIPGRELTIGAVKIDNDIIPFPITEIIAPNTFFDYEAKYTPGGCQEITPADITDDMRLQIEESAVKAYELFKCIGVVRFDYIWHETADKAYFLEVNTIPGQTETSLIPQQIEQMGWNPQQFYISLIDKLFM